MLATMRQTPKTAKFLKGTKKKSPPKRVANIQRRSREYLNEQEIDLKAFGVIRSGL